MLGSKLARAVLIAAAVAAGSVGLAPVSHAASTGTVTLTEPKAWQTLQRDPDGLTDIKISGTYTGTPGRLEASWAGGPWTTIVAAPAGGKFTGYLYNQRAGQGQMKVRHTTNTGVGAVSDNVGLGDVFIVGGDSNSSGPGFTLNKYAHPHLKATMLSNAGPWRELADPVDSATGQNPFEASYDSTAPRGSVWPLLATRIMADQGVPVAFVPTAKWGSTIGVSWLRNAWIPCNSWTLWGNQCVRAASVNRKAKAIIMLGGSNDFANVPDTNRAGFKSNVNKLVNDNWAYLKLPTMLTVPGDCDPARYSCKTPDGFDNVREVFDEVMAENPNALRGPALHDIGICDEGSDCLHFKSDTDMARVAERLWLSLDEALYGGGDSRGPRLASASVAADGLSVTATFTDADLPLLAGTGTAGFRVKVGGVPVVVTRSQVVAPDRVTIRLAAPARGAVTLSVCEERDCPGANVARDSSPARLPAEVNVDFPL